MNAFNLLRTTCTFQTLRLSRRDYHIFCENTRSVTVSARTLQRYIQRNPPVAIYNVAGSMKEAGNVQQRLFSRDTIAQSKREEHEDEEYSSDSDSDNEGGAELHPDDEDLPEKYKDLTVRVKSTRADGVLANALNIGRNSVDAAFLGSKIKFNDETLLKKSRKVQNQDCLELITSRHEGVETYKRVRILAIEVKDRSSKDKDERISVKVRAWRGNLKRDMEDEWTPGLE